MLAQLRKNFAKMIFCHVKYDSNRLELCNDDEWARASREHRVAGIDEAKTDSAGNRRAKLAVTQLGLRVLHLADVISYSAVYLYHALFLVIEDLLGYGVLSKGFPIAVKVGFLLGQDPAVAIKHALRLLQLCLVQSRVEINQRISLPHHLPFAEVNRKDLAADLTE